MVTPRRSVVIWGYPSPTDTTSATVAIYAVLPTDTGLQRTKNSIPMHPLRDKNVALLRSLTAGNGEEDETGQNAPGSTARTARQSLP